MADRRTDEALRKFASRTFWILAALVVLQLAVGGWSVYLTSRGDQANRALCALRGDLDRRIEQSKGFLVEHPEGVAGVSAKVIQDGITNQTRTVKALSGLSCG